MGLQTDRLVMVALGVLGDVPPNAIQPPLEDGIHLRWSVRADLGFPWYGFYLFRRPHRPGRPVCFGQMLPKIPPGPWPSPLLGTPFGQVSSDRPLFFTDDFPAAGVAEFDLRERSYLRYTLAAPETAWRVEVQLGFYGRQGEQTCIDFRQRAGFVGANPLAETGVLFEARVHDGTPAANTRVVPLGDLVGLHCEHRLEIALPCKADAIELTLAHFSSPGKVSAFDPAGALVATADIPDPPGVPHLVHLAGPGIIRVVVEAPQDETLLQRICFSCAGREAGANEEVVVKALHGGLVVSQASAQGAPGELVTVTLLADAITAVEVSGAQAALVDLCLYPVSQDTRRGWEPVPGVEAPICLPVRHPQYPCDARPPDEAASQALALGRIGYGAPGAWAGAPFAELHAQLLDLVEDGPAGLPMALQHAPAADSAGPPDPGAGPPHMVEQHPLQLVLLASLHPAVAQMLGLYRVDRTTRDDQPWDYLVVADHTGVGKRNVGTVLGVIATSGFVDLDGYVVHDKRRAPAPVFDPPADVRAYALPGATVGGPGGIVDAGNNAGLRWQVELLAPGVLAPGAALMFHVWRGGRGNGTVPAPAGSYALVTPEPVLVAEPRLAPGTEPVRPADWPPFPLRHIDRAPAEGWYSYRVSGIDIFGRHSQASPDAPWFQWSPAPAPRPWCYQDPPSDSAIHPSALRLLDKSGPPRPLAVEATALDPADPTLIRDAAYTGWFGALSAAEQQGLVGLRVRWQWTDAQMRQAPDTREFRIYLQPDFLNAVPGRITGVVAADATHSEVQTDIANAHGADAWIGSWLRVGASAFRVVGSGAGTPLALRVKHIGAADEIAPASGAACTLTVPQVYNSGTVSVNKGLALVKGSGTLWSAHLAGMRFKVVGPFATYEIAAVNSPTELVLDRLYEGPDDAATPYGIRFPLYVDFLQPPAWQERLYVVPYDEHVTLALDGAGRPLRKYEIMLPAAGDLGRAGLQLATSLAQPVRYAYVGVSAADDRPHTADDPKWAAGEWGGRFGNEGAVSAPAKVFVVRRTPPPAPVTPPDSARVFATRADYHGRSFHTFRWTPSAGLAALVFRALDDTLFKTDWERRAGGASVLDPAQAALFPSEWSAAKRQQVAAELNHLNSFAHDSGKVAALAYYGALSNDGLRALAGLPGNERAFAQLTAQALDPDDPANANRLGPDNPDGFPVDPGLRAYVDTLDGRSRNRYFYRAAYVDRAHNRGPLGLASPPVYCPKVVPPRTPAIARVRGGDRQVTLGWSSNREPDLADYRVYRAQGRDAARDLRLMTLVHTESVAAGDPSLRPAEVAWTDPDLPAGIDFCYRVTARDDVGNESPASAPVTARAYRAGPPDGPYAVAAARQGSGTGSLVRLSWQSAEALEVLVQRRRPGAPGWTNAGGWLPAGSVGFDDTTAAADLDYEYRLKGRDRSGRQSAASAIVAVAAGA